MADRRFRLQSERTSTSDIFRPRNVRVLAPHSQTPSPPQPPAIHRQHMPVYVIASRRTQENRRPANIPRLSPASRRNSLQNLPAARRIVPQRRRIVRRHVPRSNGVHIDSLTRPFVRQRSRQLRDPALRRRICRHQNSPLKRKYRRNIHDLPRPPLLQHPLRRELRKPEHRREVHGDYLVPILRRVFRRRSPPNNPRIVHQNIDRPQLPHRLLDQFPANRCIRNIPRHIESLPPQPAYLLANLSALRRTPMTNHISASPCQRQGDRRPNPPVRPRNQRILPIQTKRI